MIEIVKDYGYGSGFFGCLDRVLYKLGSLDQTVVTKDQLSVKLAVADEDNIGYISNIAVDRNKRGSGKGSKLLSEMIAKFRKAGCKGVLLYACPDADHLAENPDFDLVAFYKKFGFVVAKKMESGHCMYLSF